jgi:H+/Cl- antiporter ClcA
MRLFHTVYVNGKISAVAGCHIFDPIAGFIYYIYIFSTRICQLEPAVIYYALIVCVVATISTMLLVQFIFPKNVGSIGTWSMLLSGLLLVDFVRDLH